MKSFSFLTISNGNLQLAETYGMEFFETSASTNSNINEVGHGKKLSVTIEMHANVTRNSLLHSYLLRVCLFFTSSFLQCFTRMAELVLQAHNRDVDNLLGSLDDYLENAALEEEKGSQETDDNAQRTCAC